QIGPSVNVKPVPTWPTAAQLSISSSNSRLTTTCDICVPLARRLSREPVTRRQRLRQRPGHLVLQTADDLATLHLGGAVVHRQQELCLAQQLLDRRLLLALSGSVVAGDARFHPADLVVGLDDLVMEVVDYVAADSGNALGRVDVHVHGAFCVRARSLAIDAGADLGRARDLQI